MLTFEEDCPVRRCIGNPGWIAIKFHYRSKTPDICELRKERAAEPTIGLISQVEDISTRTIPHRFIETSTSFAPSEACRPPSWSYPFCALPATIIPSIARTGAHSLHASRSGRRSSHPSTAPMLAQLQIGYWRISPSNAGERRASGQ